MSRAIPTNVSTGKNANSTSIYAQIKNGNIYKLKAQVPASRAASLIAEIEQAGQIKLKHWECVRIKLPAHIEAECDAAMQHYRIDATFVETFAEQMAP